MTSLAHIAVDPMNNLDMQDHRRSGARTVQHLNMLHTGALRHPCHVVVIEKAPSPTAYDVMAQGLTDQR